MNKPVFVGGLALGFLVGAIMTGKVFAWDMFIGTTIFFGILVHNDLRSKRDA